MAKRATREEAHGYLYAAQRKGWIHGFQHLAGPPTRWRIETHSTRYEHHFDPTRRGVIVLTSREVYAFIEGCWAAAGVHPTNRAGGYDDPLPDLSEPWRSGAPEVGRG